MHSPLPDKTLQPYFGVFLDSDIQTICAFKNTKWCFGCSRKNSWSELPPRIQSVMRTNETQCEAIQAESRF